MKNLNMVCPIGYTGYGITSLNIFRALNTKYIISLFSLTDPRHIRFNSEYDKNAISRAIASAQFYESSASILKIWHQYDLALRPGKGLYSVFPFFEVDKLTTVEQHQLSQTDIIFSASKWGKDILENHNIKQKIVVCPLGVDTDIFHPQHTTEKNDKYIFIHIGKWEIRKSQDVLVHCFNKAFSYNDDVELWLVPHNPFISQEDQQKWLDMVQSSSLKHKIKVYPRLETQYDLARLISLADCGVYVSRAEGWNNELIETMAMDKPVITTNYSAHTEYCNTNNSILIDIDELEPAIDNKWFNGYGNWAKIGDNQIDDIVSAMRMVYKNNIRTNTSGVETANRLTWDETAKIISNAL